MAGQSALSLNSVPLKWCALEDTIMGGESKSAVEVDNNSICFDGNLARIGAGFCICRTADTALAIPADAKGLTINYESDDFCYNMMIYAGKYSLEFKENMKIPAKVTMDSFTAPLPRTGATNGPRTTFVPFSSFRASANGRLLPDTVLNNNEIKGVGIMCSIFGDDGIIEDAPDGDFLLTLHSVDIAL